MLIKFLNPFVKHMTSPTPEPAKTDPHYIVVGSSFDTQYLPRGGGSSAYGYGGADHYYMKVLPPTRFASLAEAQASAAEKATKSKEVFTIYMAVSEVVQAPPQVITNSLL